VQQTGRSTQCFSIEDEGSAPEASSRRVGGPSRGELAVVGPASLIIDPEFESWVWRVGDLKDKGGSLTARNLTRMGGGTKGKDASRAALSAHSKTQFCACARASLQRRTPKSGWVKDLEISHQDTCAGGRRNTWMLSCMSSLLHSASYWMRRLLFCSLPPFRYLVLVPDGK
jgi:hypothetical protein